MAIGHTKPAIFPRTPRQFLVDLGHTVMTVYWAIRLMLNRKDTKPTYMYCWHLDRTIRFRSQFEAWINASKANMEFWKKRRLFVDDMPDPASFAKYPPGTVGRAFYEMCKLHDTKGLLDLRKRRFEVLPEEAKGLDLKEIARLPEGEELYWRLVARRNIFMTSTHDLAHMLTGSNTEVDGEAIVAEYHYRHLLVPQNWMNRVLAVLVHIVTFRWKTARDIRATFPVIEQSASYAELDYERLWDKPLEDVRRQLRLPEEGFTPEDGLAQSLGLEPVKGTA